MYSIDLNSVGRRCLNFSQIRGEDIKNTKKLQIVFLQKMLTEQTFNEKAKNETEITGRTQKVQILTVPTS